MRLEKQSDTIQTAGVLVRTAVVHAEILGKRALGKDYQKYTQTAALKSSNTYSGPVVAVDNPLFVVQKVSPLHTVRHLKRDLPFLPRVGENLRIAYSAGQCRIDQNLRHVHKLAHSISL